MMTHISHRATTHTLQDIPQVSAVVPFFGQDVSSLLHCVEALRHQDYPMHRVSIIIVDNNKTPILFNESALGDCMVVHEPTRGSYAARNRGVEVAEGDIVAFTDADCIPHPGWVSAGVQAIANTNYAAMVGGRIAFTFRGDSHNIYEVLDSIIHHRQTEYVLKHSFGATANLFVHRNLLSSFGSFDPRFLSGGDREYGQRLTAKGVQIVLADDAIVFHPARFSFTSLLHKNLRGVGGDLMHGRIRGHGSIALVRTELRLFGNRNKLISAYAAKFRLAPVQNAKLRTLLAIIYMFRLLECGRLLLGGTPRRS
jgi:glycosyltransferase involved in cell wall biosynthesis